MYVYIYMCVCVCMCIYIHIYLFIDTHISTKIKKYTQTPGEAQVGPPEQWLPCCRWGGRDGGGTPHPTSLATPPPASPSQGGHCPAAGACISYFSLG